MKKLITVMLTGSLLAGCKGEPILTTAEKHDCKTNAQERSIKKYLKKGSRFLFGRSNGHIDDFVVITTNNSGVFAKWNSEYGPLGGVQYFSFHELKSPFFKQL